MQISITNIHQNTKVGLSEFESVSLAPKAIPYGEKQSIKVTKDALFEYFTYYKNDNNLKQLFSQSHITRLFRNAPIHVKDLRKFFSQEWERRGGPTSIKKIFIGHSMKGDVDLMHYNCQSENDLKKIYDKVMYRIGI